MEVGVVGINHKSCPLYLREILTRACDEIFGSNRALICPYVFLSTCNRVEIYFTGQEIASCHVKILSLLRKRVLLPFEHVLYSYFESDVFLHLVRVTSGLDSAIIGESDIQRQVKLAYEKACKDSEGKIGSSLHYLFQKSLRMAKEVRSLYSYSKERESLEEKVFSHIKTFLQEIPSRKLLLIGNSEMNRKLIVVLATKMFKKIVLYSRRGVDEELLRKHPIVQMEGETVLKDWQEYDVVISATKYPGYILHHVPRKSGHKMLIFDLSIPRSIDPLLAQDPRTTLLNSEDVAALLEHKRGVQKKELGTCEEALKRCVERYFALYRAKQFNQLTARSI
jgi:glutamyl-tRNA reductase